MKTNLKKIILSFAVMTFVVSCDIHEERDKVYDAYESVYPEFITGENSVYNLLDPANSNVDFKIEAYTTRATIQSGELFAEINGTSKKLTDMDQYPYSVDVSLSEVFSKLELTSSDVTGGDFVNFTTYFTTTKGNRITSNNRFTASIVCPPFPGQYIINMQDSYGDGWNGAAIRVAIDGVSTDYTFTSGSSASDTFTVPNGSASLVFEFISGDWDEEVSFQITDPNGNVIANVSAPSASAGTISVPSTCPN